MAYTWIDHFIARVRFRAALPHVQTGSRILDLGCGLEAAFLDYAGAKIAEGVGLDDQVQNGTGGRWQKVRADIHSPLPFSDARFDHVVMLAVLEHLPSPEPVLREAYRVIRPSGSLIMTWPSSMVDPILKVLHAIHLVSDEMESDEHQKRIPVAEIQGMLQRIGFQKFLHSRFELGLNNLMVATR